MKKIYTIGNLIFVSIVIFITTVILASILPIPGNIEIKIVQSGSMERAIKVGSLVVIKPESSYKVGDIITFGEDTKTKVPTTHRITAERIENSSIIYTTKGDANKDRDAREVKKEEVIGRVIFSVSYLGYIIDFAKKPLGFSIIVGLPSLYIAYGEVEKIVKELKKNKAKKKEENA